MAAPRIISADSHANEPEELYERLPQEYRARAPHTRKINGKLYNIFEGQPPFPAEAPNPLKEGDEFGRVMHRAGGLDIPLRLSDQEEDGISAEVIYPQAIFKIFASSDPGYQLALTQLYNDFYHGIFGPYPDRFVVSAVIPTVSVKDAVSEAKRVAKLGFRSFSVPLVMPTRPFNHPDYEPLWASIEDTGWPVAFHIATEGPSPYPVPTDPVTPLPGSDLIDTVTLFGLAMDPLVRMIGSGAVDRHPNLKFTLVECGIGWLAWVLQTMDEMVVKRHMWIQPRLQMKPSEYFKRQGYATFQEDVVGLHNRHITGVHTLMWGNDYPHDEGTFPYSQQAIQRTFAGVPEEEKRKIVFDNAARLYSFPMN